MFRALQVAATGMSAQEAQLQGVSNNIANANTVGYKRQRTEFQDLLYQTVQAPGAGGDGNGQTPMGTQYGNGVRVAGTSRAFEQGAVNVTDNPLDVAIEGSGFLVVQQRDGTSAYTRSGNLRVSGDGQLVTPEGLPIDPPITIPTGATGIAIAPDGTVTTTMPGEVEAVELGQITTATFVNPAGLNAIGHNLYTATGASGDPMIGSPGEDGHGTLLQGALEQANVNVAEEMIALIEAQRSYEVNSRVISAADEMLRSATQMK